MKPTIGLTLCLLAMSLTGVAAENSPLSRPGIPGSLQAASPERSGGGPLLAQQPALSATEIVFVFAGDLWSVPRTGGAARRLTTGVGVESSPSFSPDGKSVVFTGQYDGNTDVFVIPSEGGVPRRLTWHPDADFALGWTADGKKVLFSSTRDSYSRIRELFVAGLQGGLEEKLPLPMGWEASFSPDGQQIAYVPMSRAFFAWKRYRGGQTTPVWIAALSNSRFEKVPRENSNDFCPMWVGDKVYFLSDRSGIVTLFSYDLKTKKVAQAIPNNGMDFKSASAGPGAIVIEQFGRIQLYDLKTGQLAPVEITIAGDMSELRPKFVNVARRLINAHISPTGARALFEARGEILTVPAEKGDTRNLTGTTAVMERDPAWSPDGKWIAYFSDASGEYELHLRDSMGKGEARKIRLEDKPSFYFRPRWSPDSKKIAYLDAHLGTWYVDIDQAKPVKVDKDRYLNPPAERTPAWSPDSKWLTYSKRLKNYLSAVFVYSTVDGKSTQLTDGLSDARYPVFDKDGRYLYFTASTDSGPSLEPDIRSATQAVTRSIYLVVLSKTEPSPFAPESDEEKGVEKAEEGKRSPEGQPGEEKQDETKAEKPAADASTPGEKASTPGEKKDEKKGPEAKGVKDVRIDPEKINQRILALPLPPRRYVNLQVGKAGHLFAIEAPAPGPGVTPGLTVHRHALKERKTDVVASGIRFFEVSANGEKTLTAQQDRWTIQALRPVPTGPAAGPPSGPGAPAAAAAPQGAPGAAAGGPPAMTLNTENIEVRSEPRAEWKQMYH
ncbi:MAG: S41 family peptidase, partial [Vicinamibacterales bacterium]